MKKKIFAIISLLCLGIFSLFNINLGVNAESEIIYVSPDGLSTNEGTRENPRDLATSILLAKAGQTIIVMDGTYKSSVRYTLSAQGKYNSYITVKADEGARVIFDFSAMTFDSNNRGIQLTGDYWHFYGIEIKGAGDNGLYIAGSNNIIENCIFYENRDSGLQLGRAASSITNVNDWPSNNLIKNCTSFNNCDFETLGENADGFAAKLTVGYGNVFDGCIAYRNSDDGWDLYGKQDSGNIGVVMLYNCVAFENGFLPDAYETNEGVMTYNTTNGDGIGFKLGGSIMEGDVIMDNCMAFNNKLHGFSDNSNPGFIDMKNCTAVNNCVGINADGTVADRGIEGEENKSNNFDMARDMNSYNSYYGLLSYISNQDNFSAVGNSSYNEDLFRGSVAYSIFQTSYDEEAGEEVYVSAGDYSDVSAYEGDSLNQLTNRYTEMSDSVFASVEPINAIDEKMWSIHELFRNDDNSINMGDVLRVVDPKLLTFADGNPIGADLTKTKYEDYNHYPLTDMSTITNDIDAALSNAYDAIDVATNKDAVFQNFEIPLFVNDCEVVWTSSNPNIIEIGTEEEISLSSSVYTTAYVYSPAEDTKVTLTCEIIKSQKTITKTFELLVKNRNSKLGELINLDDQDTYIVARYQAFKKPIIKVTDSTSADESAINSSLYNLSVKYEWAESKNGNYIEVDDIYTSVPGVFKCTTTATLKLDSSQTSSYVYYVFIGKDECEIDFVGGIHYFKLNAEGFNISGTLSNVSGKVYAVVVDKKISIFSAKEIINHNDVQISIIDSDKISLNFEADNSVENGYKVYYVVSDKVGKNYSPVRSKEVNSAFVNSEQEFYDLAQGISASDSLTVYNLSKNLDFSNFDWQIVEEPAAFSGTLNGNGHTISNVSVVSDVQKQANIFYKLEGGTIMDVNFSNISIVNNHLSGKLIGIVGAMNGGYISNVDMINVSCVGAGASSTCVGALVGQMIGGINYVDHITLTNDENQSLRAGNKYVGGVVGNIQMDSGIDTLEAYISYCVVVADLGDGNDAGGCVAGIAGRIKNDKTSYYLDINNCFYKGTITVKGNYNAGILGSVESGNGLYNVSSNYADVVFIYCKEGRLVLDAKDIAIQLEENEELVYQAYAHKNLNPICGRASTLYGDVLGKNNIGSWSEYYSSVIWSTSFYFTQGPNFVPNQDYFVYSCEWDFTNGWISVENGIPSFE